MHTKTNPTQDLLPAGVWPTMLTPFDAAGEIDWPALDALVDWYIGTGAAGLFAVCLSSEMYELTAEERLQLAARVAERASGRVPVVAAGAFGDAPAEQAEMAAKLYDTGVAAVILTVNQLAKARDSEDVWRERATAIFDACGDIPLGLYECPQPYHRTLSAETLGWAAAAGRVRFYKDTCCDLPAIHAKLAAIEGTPLTWFNAHAPTLLASLREGGGGYSSVAANFIPELYVWLCQHHAHHPKVAEEVQGFLADAQATIGRKYMRNAKHYLQRLGMPIQTHCRVECPELTDEDLHNLDTLRDAATRRRITLHQYV